MNPILISSDHHNHNYKFDNPDRRLARSLKAYEIIMEWAKANLKTFDHWILGDFFTVPNSGVKTIHTFLESDYFKEIMHLILQGNHDYCNNESDSPLVLFRDAHQSTVVTNKPYFQRQDYIVFYGIPFCRKIEDFFIHLKYLKEIIDAEISQVIIMCHQFFDCTMPSGKEVIDIKEYNKILSGIKEHFKADEVMTISGHYHNKFEHQTNTPFPIHGVGALLDNSFKDEGNSRGIGVLEFDESEGMFKYKFISFNRKFKEIGTFKTHSYDDFLGNKIDFEKDLIRLDVPTEFSDNPELLPIKLKDNVKLRYPTSDVQVDQQDAKKIGMPNPVDIVKKVVANNPTVLDKDKLEKIGLEILNEVQPLVASQK